MGYKPISDYGLIGNCQSAALVALDGSIDWLSFPRFDAPSVFAAILDDEKGGRFVLSPDSDYTSTQEYVGDTNVLSTRFATQQGTCTITDCMPVYRGADGSGVAANQIIRLVHGDQGTVSLRVEYLPRPDYARRPVKLSVRDKEVVWSAQGEGMSLLSPVDLAVSGDLAQGTLTIHQGEEVEFVLSYHGGDPTESNLVGTHRELVSRTLNFWAGKVKEANYDGPWRDEIVRSYLALHLMTYLPTGGIVAAPTSSLPEGIGGVRNWDYRYTWLRDAAFTIEALVRLGHEEEALSFFGWLERICARYRGSLQIMYRVDGESQIIEEELTHLDGYQGSRPVRIGNGAFDQVQHDIYGEVLASAHLLFASSAPISDNQWEVLRTLANLAGRTWQEPDNGIWEIRGGPYNFVYSKVMCWVALDRAVALANASGRTGPESETWERLAGTIKEQVLQRGWSEEKQAFVQHYDTDAMDASNLLLPIVGFLPFDDHRVISTVKRIRQELGHGPFLSRYRTDQTNDGLAGEEGAFTLCSFWLVRVLAGMGNRAEARQIFEELLKYGNHLHLFSEMVDPSSGAALGNFPQAFTHIGLVLAALEFASDG